MDLHTAYTVMGVKPGTGDAEIKQRYRELINDLHPDKVQGRGGGEEAVQQATERLSCVNDAYDVLVRKKHQGDPTDDLWASMRDLVESYSELCFSMPENIARITHAACVAAVRLNPAMQFWYGDRQPFSQPAAQPSPEANTDDLEPQGRLVDMRKHVRT